MSLFDIQKVAVGPENLTARVRLANDAPVKTSEDLESTNRVYQLMPQIVDHACVSDQGDTFRDALGDTELAHLLEHVTVELLAQTDIAGDISSGRTTQLDDRLYQITLACSDDVLVAGALSSAVWILQWAFSGAGEPRPDVPATVEGLVALVKSLDEKDGGSPEPDPPTERGIESEPESAAEGDSDLATAESFQEPEPVPAWPEKEPVELAAESEPASEGPGETTVMRPISDLMPADAAPKAEPEPQPVVEEGPEPIEDEGPLPEAPEPYEDPAPSPEPGEVAEEPEPEPEPDPDSEPEPEPAKPADPWDLINAPRPHLVR